MNNFLKFLSFCTMLLIFFLTGCTSSKITGEWKNPDLGNKKYTSILVIGVAKQPDKRKFYEDEFTKQLTRQGIMAIASHTVIPRDKMQDRNTIINSVEDLKADSVIVTRLLGTKETKQVPHGNTYQIPYGYYNNMYDYYSNSFATAPPRSYAENHEYLQLETNLYDAETQGLVYSITTDTFLRQQFQSRITAYIETVVQQLRKNSLL